MNDYDKYIRRINYRILKPIVSITILSVIYVKLCSGCNMSCPFLYNIDALYHSGVAMVISTCLYLLFGYFLQHYPISVKKIPYVYLMIISLSLILLFSSEFTSDHTDNKFNDSNISHYLKVSTDLKKYFLNETIHTNLSNRNDYLIEYKKNIKDTFWDMLGATIIFIINVFSILLLPFIDKFNVRNK